MDFNALSLEMHEKNKGKVEIRSKINVKTMDDLSTAYTPGVAEPCRKIAANKEDVLSFDFSIYSSIVGILNLLKY